VQRNQYILVPIISVDLRRVEMSSATPLSPFVYWAQDKDAIHLKIELRNAEVNQHNCTRNFLNHIGIRLCLLSGTECTC